MTRPNQNILQDDQALELRRMTPFLIHHISSHRLSSACWFPVKATYEAGFLFGFAPVSGGIQLLFAKGSGTTLMSLGQRAYHSLSIQT